MDPAQLVSLEMPRVWASAALATPSDDNCEKSEVLNRTSLEYCIVLSTFQASEPFVLGAHFNGKTVFKIVKCGIREEALAEIFYAVAANGWSVEFGCVIREGERFTENAKRVERLLELGKEDGNRKEEARVFY